MSLSDQWHSLKLSRLTIRDIGRKLKTENNPSGVWVSRGSRTSDQWAVTFKSFVPRFMVNFFHSRTRANIIYRNYSPSRGWCSNLCWAIFHLVSVFRQNFSAEHQKRRSAPMSCFQILAFLCVRQLILCKLWGVLRWNPRFLLLFKDDPRARFYQFPNPIAEKRENSKDWNGNLGWGGSVKIGSKGKDA